MYNLGKLNVIIFISGYASVNHCLLGIMCVYHLSSRTRGLMNFLGIMSKFIMSKPPGRRLVTAEIHNYLVFSWHLVTTTFYITFVSRIIWGNLSNLNFRLNNKTFFEICNMTFYVPFLKLFFLT